MPSSCRDSLTRGPSETFTVTKLLPSNNSIALRGGFAGKYCSFDPWVCNKDTLGPLEVFDMEMLGGRALNDLPWNTAAWPSTSVYDDL
jgi:hypothetical protein